MVWKELQELWERCKEYTGGLLNRREPGLAVSHNPRSIYIIFSLYLMWKMFKSLGSKRLKSSNPPKWTTTTMQ